MSTRLLLSELAGQNRHLVVEGELDLETCPILERQLQSLGTTHDVRTEMSGITFIDSTGLNLLLSRHLAHVSAGSRLILVRPRPALGRLLDIARLRSELFIDVP